MKKMVCAFLVALLVSGIAFGSELTGTFVKKYQGVTRFEMDSLFITAELKGSTGSETKVEAFDIPKNIRVTLEKKGETLILRVVKDNWLSIPNIKARFVITLPAKTDCDLGSASGSIAIEGMSGAEMKIRTASGSVQCSGMDVPLNVSTASGSIGVSDSNAGKLLSTASGSVMLENSSGDSVINSASGTIRLENVQGAIKAESLSGSVKVSDFEGRLYLNTASGSISGTSVNLTGESTFETISGSIKLDLENKASDFTTSAKSVSGSINLFTSSGNGTIQTGSGPWKLACKTVSGSINVK